MKNKLTITVLSFAVILTIAFQQCNSGQNTTTGQIKSYVFIPISNLASNLAEQIFIPDVEVIITNAAGVNVDTSMTELDGAFRTKNLPFGTYTVKLNKAHFIATQYTVNITKAVEYPNPMVLNHNRKKIIWGTALLKDGLPGYYHQQVFNVDFDTKVMLENDASSQVRCNKYGYYVLAKPNDMIPTNITATCQTTTNTKAVGLSEKIDFLLDNTNPELGEIRPFSNTGKFLIRTHTGANIELNAISNDAENDVLEYRWKISGDNAFVSVNAQQINWTVPNKKGLYSIDVMALDNKGGAAYTCYRIEAGDEMVTFSGKVIDILTNAAIPNASVNINGANSTTTDRTGNFNFKVPQGAENDRYVLNIESPNYSLKSKIYFKEAIGETYKLVPTYTQRFDPKTPIDIVEQEDKFTHFDSRVQVLTQGNKRETKSNKRTAARVRIPANAIVDAKGKIVTENVTVSIRAIDVFNDEALMPGDFGALNGGQQARLETFGAVDVQIRSVANPSVKYNLNPASKAQIEIPISSVIANGASRNTKMPLWDYNPNTGLWDEIGKLENKGNSYNGTTNKFSVLNADVVSSNATMMKLIDNVNNPLPNGNITIQLSAPSASGGADFKAQITINRSINGNLPVLVPRLATNTVYTIVVISNGIVLNTLNPRTLGVVAGAEQWDPNVTNASYPNSNDPNVVVVKLLPDILTLSQAQKDRFLSYIENANGASDAENYYHLIGALDANGDGVDGDELTFTTWKNRAGFDPATGRGNANAVYFNAGDLNFWRSMHQITTAGKTYYYVTNYDNEVNAINNGVTGAIATVCMEYSPVVAGAGNAPVTKFFVFAGPTGALLRSANLDQNNAGPNAGEKYVPGLCITCHGGESQTEFSTGTFPDPASFQNLMNTTPGANPKFIAFDLKSFWYSQLASATRLEQEEDLRKLNKDVLTTNKTDATRDHINASYNNNINSAGQRYIDNAVVGSAADPASWNNTAPVNTVVPKNFYTDVVGPSCRTCHNSRSSTNLWFDNQTKFTTFGGSINFSVCGSGAPTRYMPNSKVTYTNFWTSQAPYQPEELRKYLNLPSCQP